jgi:hypothetical protein
MTVPNDHEITLPGDTPSGRRRHWPLVLVALGLGLAILGTMPESSWSWTEWRPSRATLEAANATALLTLTAGGLFAMAITIIVLWVGRRAVPRPGQKKTELDLTGRDKLLLFALVALGWGIAITLILLRPWELGIDLGFWNAAEQSEPLEAEAIDSMTGNVSELDAGIPEWIIPVLNALYIIGMILTVLISMIIAVYKVREAIAKRAGSAGHRRGPMAEAIAEATDEALDDLTRPGGDPRAAIIRCYARFERSLALAEAPRAPWQTAMEFMQAVLNRLPVDRTDVQRLTRLFELARFSRHPLGEAEREEAWRSLVSIRTSLDERPSDAPGR